MSLRFALCRMAVTKDAEARGWKNVGFRISCGGVIALNDAL